MASCYNVSNAGHQVAKFGFISCGLSVVSLILMIVCYASPHWTESMPSAAYYMSFGIWRACTIREINQTFGLNNSEVTLVNQTNCGNSKNFISDREWLTFIFHCMQRIWVVQVEQVERIIMLPLNDSDLPFWFLIFSVLNLLLLIRLSGAHFTNKSYKLSIWHCEYCSTLPKFILLFLKTHRFYPKFR